jgi:hypothetical protein
MRLDLDSLSPSEWEALEAVDAEPTGPSGAPWPAETNLLVNLTIWASWGLFLTEVGTTPPDGGPGAD